MAKKQTLGQQQSSSSKEITRTSLSPAPIEGTARHSFSTVPKINPAKTKPAQSTDDSLPATDDDLTLMTAQAGDADQPVLVAQLVTAESSGAGGGGTVSISGTATNHGMMLAMADEAGSVSGGAPAKDDTSSGSISPWWLVGGLAAGGIGGLAASGGGGGSTGSTSSTVSGTVTDGPVQGARLYYDVNANGTYETGTDTPVLDADGQQVVTDALGNFSFTTTQSVANIRLIASGGIDTVTGETVTVSFSAPAGYTQLNPITSAIAAYMEANPTVTAAQAETAVESALGLPNLDYSTLNLASPPAELAATALDAQRAAAILATTAIIISQSGADTDAFQYVAEHLGTGGSTSALVTAVENNPNVGQEAAGQLAATVAAVEAATSLGAIGEALNDTFFADVTTTGTVSVGQTVTGEIGLGNTTGLEVAYQWQSSADGSTWTDIAGATGTSFQLTSAESGDHIRLKAFYTDTAGVPQTVYSSDMGIVNLPPVLGNHAVSLAENSANGTAVQTVTATDGDGDTLSYAITAGNASGAFTIDAATGAITVADASKLDFETTPTFNLTVAASDGTVTDSGTVTVNLTNVNEAPSISSNGGGATAAVNVTENQTAVTTVAATDVDAGDGRTFSITGGADAALFAVNTTTGALTFLSGANYEAPADAGANNVYDVQVTVTDTAGLADVQTLAVTVINTNEAPAISSNGGGATAAVNVAENQTAVTTVTATDVDAGDGKTFSITGGADADLFVINTTTGALTFISAPNFEVPADVGPNNVYDVQITVTDTAGLSDVQALAVTVTNVNDNPVSTISDSNDGANTVVENAAVGTAVGLTALATDADTGATINYSLSNDAGGRFTIDASGVVTVADDTLLNYEAATSHTITVRATSSDGSTNSQAFIINLSNVNESVVVESSGAWIDLNANGVKDAEDTTPADFAGNIDMAANPVTIHFNNVPDSSIDLTGFTSDDKIEIDVPSFNELWMQRSPAHGFTTLQTNPFVATAPNYVYLQMDNSYSYSVFFKSQLSLTPEHQGSLAFYNYDYSTFSYLAYWNDSANPLLDIHNILPGIGTASGRVTASIPTALSELNQGVGHGVLIDFVWPAPQDIHVVVEQRGAFLDANANGVVDEGETRTVFGSDVALAFNHVTVHFNDVPDSGVDLSGFGADDLIEIDVQAFIDNGHNALQILTRPEISSPLLINQTAPVITSTANNWLDQGRYGNLVMQEIVTNGGLHTPVALSAGLYFSTAPSQQLYFFSNRGAGAVNNQLGYQLSPGIPLQQMVDYVNLPQVADPVYVIVEQSGAIIDGNGNGVQESGENWAANFGPGGNADLASNTVVIHFNNVPTSALDLSGFGSDDLIQIDAQALYSNGYQGLAVLGHPAVTKTLDQFTQASRITLSGFSQELGISGAAGGYYSLWNNPSSSGFDIWHTQNSAAGALYLTTWNTVSRMLASFTALDLSASPLTPLQAMVDFVNLPETIQVVVDSRGTFIDANANGIVDGDELANPADFASGGNVVMGYDHVTVQFNDIPANVINLSGFGSDDLIEIDVQAFIDNGHNALQLLTLPFVIKTLAGSSANGGFWGTSTNNNLNDSKYFVSNRYEKTNGATVWAKASFSLSLSTRLYFNSYNGSTNTGWQMGSGLPTDMTLQQMVDFVNPPTPPDTIHVIVGQNGATIDIDGDGVRDIGENRLADFSGNADLTTNSVIVHFNDIPMTALNLNGFGTDDKIEFDGGESWLANFGVGSGPNWVSYHLAKYSGTAIVNTTIKVNQFTALTLYDVNGISRTFTASSGAYAMTVSMGGLNGAIAYWNDASNALNSRTMLLPDYNTASADEVLAHLNANGYQGLVEFVWPVNVVIETDGAYIDVNANGVRDADDTTVADFTSGTGNADLATNAVTLHFNGVPDSPVDFTGFGADDMLQIDVNAIRFGSGKSLNSQNTSLATSWTDDSGITGGTVYVSSTSLNYPGVYLDGSKLKFGHSSSYFYTATTVNEGTIASNAAALAGHYNQQVVFVTTPAPIT